jgi:hypothetical protein
LRIPKFKTYFDILKKGNPNVTIGASNDKTGNLKYGGNWTMENTNDNIKHEYFTDAIGVYNNLLASTSPNQPGKPIVSQVVKDNLKQLKIIWTRPSNYSEWSSQSGSIELTMFKSGTLESFAITLSDISTTQAFVNTTTNPMIIFGREYSARVKYTNEYGPGVISEMSDVHSLVTEPSKSTGLAVSNLTPSDDSSEDNPHLQLTVSWTPPSNGGGQGVDDVFDAQIRSTYGYLILLYGAPSVGLMQFYVHGPSTTVTINWNTIFNNNKTHSGLVRMAIKTYNNKGFYSVSENFDFNFTVMPHPTDATETVSGRTYTFTYIVGIPTCTIKEIDDKSGAVVLPNTLHDGDGNAYSVTATSESLFNQVTTVTTIVLPSTLLSIPNYFARQATNLVGITSDSTTLTGFSLPSSVTSIGVHAFESCNSLYHIVVPETVTTIGALAFARMNELESLVYPDSLTTIVRENGTEMDSTNYLEGFAMNYRCFKLKTVVYGDGLTAIPGGECYGSGELESITIGSSVTHIGQAFDTAFAFMNELFNGSRPKLIFRGVPTTIHELAFNIHDGFSRQRAQVFSVLDIYMMDGNTEYKYIAGPVGSRENLITIATGFDSSTAVSSGNFMKTSEVPTPTASADGVSKFTSFAGTIDLTDTSIVGTTTTEKRDYTFNQMKKLVDSVSDSNGFASKNFFELDNVGQLPGLKRAYANLKVFKPNTEVDTSEISSGAAIYTPLDSGSYIIIPEGPSSSVKWKITKTSETAYTRQLTTGGDITTHTKGDEFNLGSANVILGSVELSYSDSEGVNIVLTAFNTTVSMSTNAIVAGDWSISGDATITLNNTVPKSELQNTFFYHLTGSSVHYYVDSAAFTNAVTVLNPKNGKIVTTGDGAYVSGDSIGEDYLRDTARQLFGTYLGADLFTNEDGVVEHINSKCDDVASTIMGILTNVNITSNSLTNTDSNLNNAKYLSDSTADTNICRELVNQMHNSVGTRFQDLNTSVYNGMSGYYYVPFQNGDVISYKVTLEAPSDQHTVVATGASALTARTYVVNLNVVD